MTRFFIILAFVVALSGYSLDLKTTFKQRSGSEFVSCEDMWKFKVNLPGKNEYVSKSVVDPGENTHLKLVFINVSELPGDYSIYVFAVDWDHQWYQIRIMKTDLVKSGGVVEVPLVGEKATSLWQSVGHDRKWHNRTSRHLKEWGIKVEDGESWSGELVCTSISYEKKELHEKPFITDLEYSENAEVGKMKEVSFELHGSLLDPLNEIKVKGTLQQADGSEVKISGFYKEEFSLNSQNLPQEEMIARGYPRFALRFTPVADGKHILKFEVVAGEVKVAATQLEFEVEANTEFKGFIKKDPKDYRYLAYDNGEHYWGIAMNVRSPYDTRYIRNVPSSRWYDEGLEMYRRLFEKYSECGVNTVEVWLSSWWLSLEWIADDQGNHGAGWFNQHRAAKLDRIFEWADQYDINLILVLNNHGRFSTHTDAEWKRSPFYKRNGGKYNRPEEWFSSAEAKEGFRNFADYLINRWSCQPHLLTWKLFTEIDLIVSTRHFFDTPTMINWHKEMGQYMQDNDPYKHLVTTHWMMSYQNINSAIASLPQMDILTADAYYNGSSSKSLVDLFIGTARLADTYKKPVIISEYGGSPQATDVTTLKKQAYLSGWNGFFLGMAAGPGFWWYGVSDEYNLYPRYKRFSDFVAGTDRRDMKLSRNTSDGKFVLQMENETTCIAWCMDTKYFYTTSELYKPEKQIGPTLNVAGLKKGKYKLEIVFPYTNAETITKTVDINTDSLELPEFSADMAVKLTAVK